MNPTVTIAIPTYNGAQWLDEALASVCAQSGNDIEILLCDDCSSDRTLEIAQQWALRDGRLRVERNPVNLGLVGNWNRCLTQAHGEWVKFLFQDDWILPHYISTVRPLLSGPYAFVLTHRTFRVESDTNPTTARFFQSDLLKTLRDFAPGQTEFTPEDVCNLVLQMAGYNFLGEPSNTLFRKSLAMELGGFHGQMSQLVDLEYWFRLGTNHGIRFVPEPLSVFRVHGQSTTAHNQLKQEFRSRSLDTMVMFHDFCFHPHYRNLRKVATTAGLRISGYLDTAIRNAIAKAEEMERDTNKAQFLPECVLEPLAEAFELMPQLGREFSLLSESWGTRVRNNPRERR